MQLNITFTEKEYAEYQKWKNNFDKVVSQRDEVIRRFRNLEDAINKEHYHVITHCGEDTPTYELEKNNQEDERLLKEFWPNYGGCYLSPYDGYRRDSRYE